MAALSVLVVEDDQAQRELLRRLLANWGFAVDIAVDAKSALEAMLRHSADIVVLDIGMPGHNGLRFAERVRANWPRTPIVITTGRDDVDTITKARQLGAVDYLLKPFRREMLRQALDRAELKIRQSTVPPDMLKFLLSLYQVIGLIRPLCGLIGASGLTVALHRPIKPSDWR